MANGFRGMISSEEFWNARVNWINELMHCQRHSDQRISLLTTEFKTKMDGKVALLTDLYSEIEKITCQIGNEKSYHQNTKQKLDGTKLVFLTLII